MFLIRFRTNNRLILLYHTEQIFEIGLVKIFFKRLPKTISEIPNGTVDFSKKSTQQAPLCQPKHNGAYEK